MNLGTLGGKKRASGKASILAGACRMGRSSTAYQAEEDRDTTLLSDLNLRVRTLSIGVC